MYVCMYVYMYLNMYTIFIYTRIECEDIDLLVDKKQHTVIVRSYIVCMYVCYMYVCMYVCMLYVCMYLYIYAICMYVCYMYCMCVRCMYVCTYVICMYVCVYVCNVCMYVFIVSRALHGEGRGVADAGLDQRPAGVALPRHPASGYQAGKPPFRHSRPRHCQDNDNRFRTVQNEQ